jgi:hypothetical protein
MHSHVKKVCHSLKDNNSRNESTDLTGGGGQRLVDGGSIDGLKYLQPLVEWHFSRVFLK